MFCRGISHVSVARSLPHTNADSWAIFAEYPLPTWVIDWTAFGKSDVFASLAASGQFNATGDSTAKPFFSSQGKCTIQGLAIDTVDVVGKPLDLPLDRARLYEVYTLAIGLIHVFGWLETLIQHIGPEALQKSSYITGEDYLDVVWPKFTATWRSDESRWYKPGLQTENTVSDERLRATFEAAMPIRSIWFPSRKFDYSRASTYKWIFTCIK